MAEKVLMLECDKNVSGLEELLGLVSLGRQYCTIEVRSPTGVLGEVVVKAGHILQAEVTGASGRAAFAALMYHPQAAFFAVYRHIFPPRPFPDPVGTIEQVLLESAVGHDEANRAVTAEKAVPAEISLPPANAATAPVAAVAAVPHSTPSASAPVGLPWWGRAWQSFKTFWGNLFR